MQSGFVFLTVTYPRLSLIQFKRNVEFARNEVREKHVAQGLDLILKATLGPVLAVTRGTQSED